RDVQSGTADEDRVTAASVDLRDRLAGLGLVPGDGRLFRDLPHIQEVVRDAAALARAQLRRADVHAPVQLHGVCVDDLRRIAACPQALCEIDREVALAG